MKIICFVSFFFFSNVIIYLKLFNSAKNVKSDKNLFICAYDDLHVGFINLGARPHVGFGPDWGGERQKISLEGLCKTFKFCYFDKKSKGNKESESDGLLIMTR